MCCTQKKQLVHKKNNWLFTVINNCMLIVFVSTFTSLYHSVHNLLFLFYLSWSSASFVGCVIGLPLKYLMTQTVRLMISPPRGSQSDSPLQLVMFVFVSCTCHVFFCIFDYLSMPINMLSEIMALLVP